MNCGVSRRQHPEEVGNGLAGGSGDVGEGAEHGFLMVGLQIHPAASVLRPGLFLLDSGDA